MSSSDRGEPAREATRPPLPRGERTSLFEFALIVGAAVVAAAALTLWMRDRAERADEVATTESGTAGLAVGRVAPPVTAPYWINGEPEELEGRVRVVHGWFTTCPYCMQEAPELVKLHREFGDEAVFVGLAPEGAEQREQVAAFVERAGFTWPNGYGAVDTLVAFDAQFFPVLWVIGKDGRVVWNRDRERETSLEEAIRLALAEG